MKHPERDAKYMALALRLAARGRGRTSPNPLVGAVVVAGQRGDRIVGQGFHRRAGGPHAEVYALRAAGARAQGGTLYVSLEPCSHLRKRTPPCVPLIQASGIKRVVVAMRDPNVRVRGRGLAALRRAGIKVEVGCLRGEAARLNEQYCHWITTGRPFVILKAAITLDGKIATARGDAWWITGETARRHAHRLRSRVDAVLVGLGTVLKDDPQLTARIVRKGSERLAPRQPLRVVLDSRLRIPPSAKVLRGNPRSKAIVATTRLARPQGIDRLRKAGVTVMVCPAAGGRVSLPACLRRLARMGVTSLLLEGGSEVNASALQAGLVNRVCLYVAPRLLGGRDAKGMIGGSSPRLVREALGLDGVRIRRVGRDFLIEGRVTLREDLRRGF